MAKKLWLGLLLLSVLASALMWGLRQHRAVSPSTGKADMTSLQVQLRSDRVRAGAVLNVQLTPELEEAAWRGIPLYFRLDAVLLRTHRWWFNHTLVSRYLIWRIQYNALLRQWVVQKSGEYEYFFSLAEALSNINDATFWDMPLEAPLTGGGRYQLRALIKLDTSRLPGPFQIYTFSKNSNWSLSSQWKSLDFNTSAEE